jgi:LacI family transcriptional regulator
MRELARHLIVDHGYRTLGFLAGHEGSPDSLARARTLAEEVAAEGATLVQGDQWRGSYQAAGGAQAIERLIAAGSALPRAIVCANDQSAMGVLYALAEHGIAVPGEVAVTGFDDIPLARILRPQLTTVRQSIQDLGATAFETLYAMIRGGSPAAESAGGRDIALPAALMRRESCGCGPQPGAVRLVPGQPQTRAQAHRAPAPGNAEEAE